MKEDQVSPFFVLWIAKSEEAASQSLNMAAPYYYSLCLFMIVCIILLY